MWTIMPLSAASCEQGASPSLSQGCRNITPLWQFICSEMRTALSCSRWFWAVLNIFWNNIIGLHSATESFPSRVPFLRFSIISSVVFTYDVISVPFTQLLFHIGSEHILGMHIRAKFRRLQASARSTWLVRLTWGPATLGVMSSCFSDASSRHRTMSDLVPSFSFPLAVTDCGHGWFSLEK